MCKRRHSLFIKTFIQRGNALFPIAQCFSAPAATCGLKESAFLRAVPSKSRQPVPSRIDAIRGYENELGG